MSFKITLPTPAPEPLVFPWLYATPTGSIWFAWNVHNARCILASGGGNVPDGVGIGTRCPDRPLDELRRLTRDEIAGLGLRRLVPPPYEAEPPLNLKTAKAPFYFIGDSGRHLYYVDRQQIVHDIAHPSHETPDFSSGKLLGDSWSASQVLPAGTKIEITVE